MSRKFTYWLLMLTVGLSASAQIEIATFENLELPDNSYWSGELDEDDEDMGFSRSWFESGSFSFNNFYWPDYYTWAFFAYSNHTENTFKSYANDQFNSITGSGADGSRTFGVAFPASYMGNTIMEVGTGLTPTVVPGMEIVNTAWVVDCILNGDGYESAFKTGDWMKLILTGYANDNQTSTKEYYLADYRSENIAEHYFLDKWTWIDLSELGAVTSIHFSIDSSKKNAYGVTTPTYVCIDNVGIEDRAGVQDTGADRSIVLNYIAGSRRLAVSGATGRSVYYVSDMSGRTVLQGSAENPNFAVNFSSLPRGIYIVGVKDSATVKTLKLKL